MEILDRYHIETSGKNCVVLGRSNIVGRPISIMLSTKGNPGDATVTVCHSRTPREELLTYTRKADIIVVALGIPEFLTGDMVKEGVVIIDVGTTRVDTPTRKRGWRLVGDVHFESVAAKASHITPVPGGVGPMTVTMLIKNTLEAYKRKI
jgi:methylenetetrahydrofolate dehydrogenase (NADP+)/methenyltetrahydrofolate cyclohydrolase